MDKAGYHFRKCENVIVDTYSAFSCLLRIPYNTLQKHMVF